jgi:hypothetical protein
VFFSLHIQAQPTARGGHQPDSPGLSRCRRHGGIRYCHGVRESLLGRHLKQRKRAASRRATACHTDSVGASRGAIFHRRLAAAGGGGADSSRTRRPSADAGWADLVLLGRD